MGRIDSQIKIRGNRIEPGEIESRLLLHEDIQETVVAAVTDKQKQTLVCIYRKRQRARISTIAGIPVKVASRLHDTLIFVRLESLT